MDDSIQRGADYQPGTDRIGLSGAIWIVIGLFCVFLKISTPYLIGPQFWQ